MVKTKKKIMKKRREMYNHAHIYLSSNVLFCVVHRNFVAAKIKLRHHEDE